MPRSPNLQAFLDAFAEDHNIGETFREASDHPYSCRCDKCKAFWKHLGPDEETGEFGPFTREEME